MNIKTIPIDDLKPYAHNPKTHPAEQVEKIAKSITEFGFLVPILIDADNQIIAGHGRILAARKLGLNEIPAIRIDHLTEAQIRAYRIADNRLTESAWDLELLESEMAILSDMEFDIDLTGFDDIELGELFGDDEDSGLSDINDKIYDTKVQSGADLFEHIDIVLTIQRPPFADIATHLGFKLGAQSGGKVPEDIGNYIFIDNEFKNYNHAQHLAWVRAAQPKYATVRDYIPEDKCKQMGVKYYPLSVLLEHAEQISEYAENVIFIPKDETIIDQIPDEYVIGFATPSEYGETDIALDELSDRKLHILGGSPAIQYRIAVHCPNVVSMDNNYIQGVANRWCYYMGANNGPVKDVLGMEYDRNHEVALILNIYYTYNLFHGLIEGEI